MLAAVLGSVPDAILTTDLDARIVLVNAAAETLLGVRREAVRGRDAVDVLVHPDDRDAAREWARRIAAGEQIPPGRLARLVRGDGSVFSAEVSVSPIADDGGELLGMVAMVRDVTARLAAEEHAATLHAILDAAAEAIVGVDRRGDIQFFSPSAERLYGWRAEEVIGRPVTVLIPELAMPQFPAVRDALLAGRTVHREGMALRKDGTVVEAELNASPVIGADGRVQGTALIVLDVSERRRAQRLFERFMAHAPNTLAVKDREGRYLYFSAHAAADIGRTVSEMLGRTDHELFGRAIAERLSAQDRAVMLDGKPRTYENSWQGTDGATRTFVTTKFPLPGPDGEVEAIGMIGADVSEIRRAETDRAQLAALVQAAPDAIVARDRQGRIATWNPGAEAMFGLTADEAIGRRYVDLLVPDYERESFVRMLDEVHRGRTVTLRGYRLRADGSRFPAQISMAPLTLLDGTWHGTLAMIRDITELVQAELELRERAAQLERSNADLERFAYAASHDLQEPLHSIRLSAGAVIEAAHERLDADERELIEHIDASASRLSGQVRGLMEVAQVALGRAPGEHVALAVAVRDAVDALRAAARAAGAAIEVEPELPDVLVPRTELSAALQNVVSNAIKYRRPDVAPLVSITARRGETMLEVRVDDNGIGLGTGDLDRVFGLFERGPSGVQGTGMGLAVARAMLERLGGTIVAASDGPGRGCRFTLRVPIQGG